MTIHLKLEQLVELHYGETDDEQLQAHLLTCSQCQMKLMELKRISDGLDQSEYRQPSLQLDSAIVFGDSAVSEIEELNDSNVYTVLAPTLLEQSNQQFWSAATSKTAWSIAGLLVATVCFFAGAKFRSINMNDEIESAVAVRLHSELDQRDQVHATRMQSLENELAKKMAIASEDQVRLKRDFFEVLRGYRLEQQRIGRELQTLATNTDNAFRITNTTTNRNNNTLTRLQELTGMEFIP